MRPRTSIAALWPALLGVLAAHQIAYSGHDDGHVHGYLETVGPALAVAAVLGWIWSWARAHIEFRSVLGLQLALFVAMEGSERLVAGFAISDLAPIAVALLLIPLVAVLTVLADRMIDLIGSGRRQAGVIGVRPLAWRVALLQPQSARCAAWSIRAPPCVV